MEISVGVAMEIAGVDPLRFNDAVARRYYRCAPETRPGAKRMFDHHDLVGLCVFGHLLRLNFTSPEAGAYACNVAGVVNDRRIHIDKLHLIYGADGRVDQHFRARGQAPLQIDAAVYITIDLDAIRKQIRVGLAEYYAPGELDLPE